MTTGWERLNAYVDQELDPADAAEVAAAVARDPDLAARVATLSRLKATTSALSRSDVPPPAPRLPIRRSSRRFLPVAASILLIVATATALWLWPPGLGSRTAWLDDAVAAHQAWLDETAAPSAGDRIWVALEARELADVPDLSQASLSLVRVSAVPVEGRTGVFLGYQGVHGCRVGLWIGDAAAGLEPRPIPIESSGLSGYAWRAGTAGYALLARGMDPERLRLLADAVAKITSRQHQLDEDIRTALRQTTERGVPCPT